MTVGHFRSQMPWDADHEQERKFKRLSLIVLGVYFFLALVMSFLPLPDLPKKQTVELPPRLAQLLLDRQKAPPVPKPQPKPKEEKKPEPKKPEEKPKPKPAEKPKPKPKPKEEPKPSAKEKAASSGLLAFADDLADLREAPAITKTLSKNKLTKANTVNAGDKNSAPTRSIVTAAAAGSGSGGINTSNLSRDTGGTNLQGRSTSKVESTSATQVAAAAKQTAGGGANRSASRSQEEITEIIDRNKSVLFRIYNRALRKNPLLKGKVVLDVTISPSGKVTNVKLVSSDLNDQDLENKLMSRIKLINFGRKDVGAITVRQSLDFFPA